MYRTYTERNHNDWKKAIRKQKIDRFIHFGISFDEGKPILHDYYNNLHQYSKNKVHCSCPLCSCKTNNRGRYGSAYNPPIHDLKQINRSQEFYEA